MTSIRVFVAVILLVGMFGSSVFARSAPGQQTPGVDRRERRQSRRIKQGVRSGSLTRREARNIAAQQARIRRHERRAKSDGVVTARERASLQRRENRASRNIYRKKHNFRHR